MRWGEEAAEGADELVLRGLAEALVVDPKDAVKGPGARGVQGDQAKLMENDDIVLILKMVLESTIRTVGGCNRPRIRGTPGYVGARARFLHLQFSKVLVLVTLIGT